MSQIAFVTGAGGCVGRRLLTELLSDGWSVTALLLSEEADTFAFRDHPRVQSVIGEINTLAPEAIPDESVVYHLAAQVHTVPKSSDQTQRFFAVNRDGTAHVAEAAGQRNARGFLFLSTIAVYGEALGREICDENTPPEPNTPYGSSKYQAEQKLTEILSGRVPYVILRPCVIYGPGDRGNFGRLIRSVLRGRFPVVDGGGARKNTLYVGNLARIMTYMGRQLTKYNGQVFNVADPESRTFRQIAEAVAEVAGIRLRIRSLPSWLLRPFALLGDLGGSILRREMPISSRRLDVMTGDSLVNVDKLYNALNDDVSITSFSEGLQQYFASEYAPR